MFVRLAVEQDTSELLQLTEAGVKELMPRHAYSETRFKQTIQSYLDRGNPTLFVVEEDRKVIAFLMASLHTHWFLDGHFASQDVIYVRPDKRGTRAAAMLVKRLTAWSDQLGVTEIIGGTETSFQPERTVRFLKHFGFRELGFCLYREISNGKRA